MTIFKQKFAPLEDTFSYHEIRDTSEYNIIITSEQAGSSCLFQFTEARVVVISTQQNQELNIRFLVSFDTQRLQLLLHASNVQKCDQRLDQSGIGRIEEKRE
jgi:hypothetical protein